MWMLIKQKSNSIVMTGLCLLGALIAIGHYILPRPSVEVVMEHNPPPGREWFLEHLPRYFDYPVMTFLHVIPSAIFMVLVIFQLSSRLRQSYPRLHRGNGWFLFVLAWLFAISGLQLAISMPFAGSQETIVIAIFFLMFVTFLIQGISAARKADYPLHRRMMLRMIALALAPVIMRPIFSILVMSGISGPDSFVPSLLASIVVNLLVVEKLLSSRLS